MGIELTESQKEELLGLVANAEVDVSCLPSYESIHDPYCVGYPLCMGSGDGDWDENEEYAAQIEEAIDRVQADGVLEHVTAPADANDYGELEEAVVEFLEKLLEKAKKDVP